MALRVRNSCAPCWSLSQAFGFLPRRLPGLPFLLPWPGMAASWFAAFLPLNLMGSCFPAPPQSVPSFLTDTPESHQFLKAQGLSLPMDAAQHWKWQPFLNACLSPLERLPPSQFSMLNHTLIGPLSLATLLSQPALHSTSDRPGVFSVSLYTLSSWGILIAPCSLSTLGIHSCPLLPPLAPAARPFAVSVVSQLYWP